MTMQPMDLQQPQDPQANFGGGIISRLLAQHENRQNANKQAMAAASATERYLKMNAKQLGVDPDQVQQQANESPIQYNQRLNSAIANVMVGQKIKEQNAQIAANQAYVASQGAALQGQQAQTQAIQTQTAGQQIGNQQQQLALDQQRRQAAYLQSLIGGQGNGMGSQAGQPPQAPSNIPPYLQPNQPQGQAPAAPQAQPMPQGQAPAAAPQPMPPMTASAMAQPQMGAADDTAGKFAQFYQNYVRTVHAPPTPEAAQNFLSKTLDAEKPIGLVPAGLQQDANGHVIAQKWSWVTQNGRGSRTVKPPEMALPIGQLPQGQVLDSKTFKPLTPNGQPSAQAGADTPTSVPMTPDRQAAIKDATEHLNMLSQNDTKINGLGQQVAAYIQKNPGVKANALMGTPAGLAVRRMIWGDVTGQNLEQGVANNLNSIMDNMREGGKGSLGMRLTGSYWHQLKEAFPHPTQAPETQIQGWKNIATTNAYGKKYTENYLRNLQTMLPGDAAKKANEETEKPDFAKMVLPKAPIIAPAAAVDYLKKHPTTAAHFDQKFGPGAAAQVLATK